MILAAGLSPAWQQIMQFDSFSPGEVNRASEVQWCASGKVLNTGIAAHYLGRRVKTLAFVGGLSGQAIQQEFSHLGVDARWIEAAEATRVCTTILDSSTGRTTELVENARPASTEELQAYLEAFSSEGDEADVVVLTGSLPVGTPSTYYAELIENVEAKLVLDIRGPAMLKTLSAKPLLVKPNREELEQTVGHSLESDEELVAAMRELNVHGAKWVMISNGGQAAFLTSLDEGYRLSPPQVEVVNPIGCGDCLSAGIATAIYEGRPMVEAVQFGMAAAGENIRQLLPARLDRRRVEALAELVEFSRV